MLYYNSFTELCQAFFPYNSHISSESGGIRMKLRKKPYGDCNLVGKNIERIRKEKNIKQKDFVAMIQVMGIDINPTSYSKLEGQLRIATDKEVYTIAKILSVDINELFRED